MNRKLSPSQICLESVRGFTIDKQSFVPPHSLAYPQPALTPQLTPKRPFPPYTPIAEPQWFLPLVKRPSKLSGYLRLDVLGHCNDAHSKPVMYSPQNTEKETAVK
jgi:hypothetical protein